MKEQKLITLAVHTNKKAQILKDFLEEAGIDVYIETIDGKQPSDVTPGVRVRVREEDLATALSLVESEHLFSYAKKETYLVDDGNLRILVPVDFSDYSLNACRIAFNIAKLHNAKVKIFTVYYNPFYPIDLPFADMLYGTSNEKEKATNILDKVRQNMNTLIAEIDRRVESGEFPTVNYSYSIREGVADEEIAEYSKQYKPGLIIMGTKGSTDRTEDMLGSVTAEVIEMTDIPLLAIPKDSLLTDPQKIKHIAFSTNFTQRDLITFDNMYRFAKPYGRDIKITLLHVNVIGKNKPVCSEENVQKILGYIHEHYPEMNIDYKQIDTNDDMYTSIGQFIVDEQIEVVTVNTRRRNVFTRLFVPSVSRKILANSKAALLVLRGK